jgi:hypothetical protein
MLFDGTVSIDSRERVLTVRPATHARGYAKVLWSETVQALVDAQNPGRLTSPPTPWASFGGYDRIRYGVPDRDGSLKFRFHRGEEIYKTLVSTVGLHARITVDRSNGRISVAFRGRR